MKAMSRNARRREVRRLIAFERRHASEMQRLARQVEMLRHELRGVRHERDTVSSKLRELFSPRLPESRDLVVLADRTMPYGLILPVRIG